MSELREECYKCLNNQTCPSCADYGSIICMTKRKYEMPKNREDSVYATRFAVMQQQINEKDKRIKELEEALLKVKYKNVKLFIHYKNSIPKQKVKDTLTEIQKEYEKLDKASDDFLNNKEKTAEDYVLEKERLATMQTLAYCRDNLEELLEEK